MHSYDRRSVSVARLHDGRPGVGVRVSLSGLLLGAAWICVATALQLARQPGVPSWDSLWQEDGGIFLTDALDGAFLPTLFEPYNSYLHLVPRLIGALAAALPIDAAAFVFAASSALVVSLLAVYVYFAAAAMLSSQWARALLAVLFVLLPAAGYETNANAANLHWYLVFACFWVFLFASDSWLAVVSGAVVAVAAVLSDPLAGLFLPLAVLHAVRSRTWRVRSVPILFAAALALQLAVGAASDPPDPYAESRWSDVPSIFALRVAGSLLVGDVFLDDFWIRFGWWFAYGALAVVVAVTVYALVRGDRRTRLLVAASVAYSAAFLAVPLMLRGTENFLDRANFNLNGSRYTVVPILFLVVAFLAVLERRDPRVSSVGWRNLRYGFTLFMGALVLTSYPVVAVRTAGPSWRATLAEARDYCPETRRPGERVPLVGSLLERTRPPNETRIPIAPNIQPPTFAVTATCRRLGWDPASETASTSP